MADEKRAGQNVLFPNEAEVMVELLDASSFENIGDKKWWKRHEMVEKLNMQAIVNISSDADEFVKEFLISYNKIGLLIYDLLVAELWTEKIFPLVKSEVKEMKTTLPVYMCLFHEATVLSLLETSLFYKETCEAAEDSINDIVDYLNRKVTTIILDYSQEREGQEESEELERQFRTIQYTLCMKSLSILRYLSDAIEYIPLSAITRMLDTHDFACLLVRILDISPWKRTNSKNKREVFENNKWVEVSPFEFNLISKLEAQVWLTIYQLLLHPEAQRKYDYNLYRKTEILNLRKYFNEMLLDQMPHLRDLQIYIEHLSVTEAPSIKQNLIIEQVPEVRLQLEQKYNGKWKSIASRQIKEYFDLNDAQMKEQADHLAATYNLDVLETLIDEPPVCSNCEGEALKRCSRCQSEWYCSRPCQVKHWSKHKTFCDILIKAEKADK